MLKGMNSSSSSSDASDTEETSPDAPFQMPASRPNFGPIEASTVLSRLRQFIPVFIAAPTENCDPLVLDEAILTQEPNPDAVEPGVEMQLSLGVYDVEGKVDEGKLSEMGIPVVGQEKAEPSLIQEI